MYTVRFIATLEGLN